MQPLPNTPYPQPNTSLSRYRHRKDYFQRHDLPIYKYYFWWVVHNSIAHPILGILPVRWVFQFHDYTSKKINGWGIHARKTR